MTAKARSAAPYNGRRSLSPPWQPRYAMPTVIVVTGVFALLRLVSAYGRRAAMYDWIGVTMAAAVVGLLVAIYAMGM